MKLDEIKKKNIYKVPDKYFDQLPTRIQSRVNEKRPVFGWNWNPGLIFKVATPAIAVVLMLFYFGKGDNNTAQDFDTLLAEISNEEIIAYLENTDITTEEIIEVIDFSEMELDFYEDGSIIHDLQEIDEEDLNILFDEYGVDDPIL